MKTTSKYASGKSLFEILKPYVLICLSAHTHTHTFTILVGIYSAYIDVRAIWKATFWCIFCYYCFNIVSYMTNSNG